MAVNESRWSGFKELSDNEPVQAPEGVFPPGSVARISRESCTCDPPYRDEDGTEVFGNEECPVHFPAAAEATKP